MIGKRQAILPRLAVNYPASSPFVTGVGGTNLTLNAANQIISEDVWNDAGKAAFAGGGGFSGLFNRPSYQAAVAPSGVRVVPDVSMLADLGPGYTIYCTAKSKFCHGWTSVGGTSAAAPLLAGGMALVDQDLARHHRAFVGLANPLLYELGDSAHAAAVFRDVTAVGNDLGPYLPEGNGQPLGCCSAHAGFDAASGWGSVQVAALDQAAVSLLPLAPDVRLRLPGHQRPLAARGVRTVVRCSTACRVWVTGELVLSPTQGANVHSPVHTLSRAGTVRLRVSLSAAQIRRARAALAAHRNVFAELFAVALDASGKPLKVTSAAVIPVRG